MRGCRPLTKSEAEAMYLAYAGRHAVRNRCLHILCITTGLRVSEALSITVGDVVKKSQVVRRVQIRRKNTKGGRQGRTIDIPTPARHAIAHQLRWLLEHGHLGADQFLFRSQRGRGPITRVEAWRIFNIAARSAGLDEDMGILGTHSWRKTFANDVNRHFLLLLTSGKAINPMLETSRALNHKSVESTEKYLSFDLGCHQSAMRHIEEVHSYASR